MGGRQPGVVRARQWWAGLRPGQRRLLVTVAAAETALKVAMLVDLSRRPAGRVRGPKWLWASTTLVNSAGVAPIAYFLLGRR